MQSSVSRRPGATAGPQLPRRYCSSIKPRHLIGGWSAAGINSGWVGDCGSRLSTTAFCPSATPACVSPSGTGARGCSGVAGSITVLTLYRCSGAAMAKANRCLTNGITKGLATWLMGCLQESCVGGTASAGCALPRAPCLTRRGTGSRAGGNARGTGTARRGLHRGRSATGRWAGFAPGARN